MGAESELPEGYITLPRPLDRFSDRYNRFLLERPIPNRLAVVAAAGVALMIIGQVVIGGMNPVAIPEEGISEAGRKTIASYVFLFALAANTANEYQLRIHNHPRSLLRMMGI